jgi:PrtD family type I secretion system ABC transporter
MNLTHAIRSSAAIALGSSAVTHLLVLIPTLITLQIYDRVLANRRPETLAMLMLCAALSLLAWWVVETGRAHWFSAQSAALEHSLSQRAHAQVLHMHLQRASSAAQQVWQDIGALRSFVASPMAVAVVDLPWCLVYLLVMTAFHPLMGAVALLGIAILAGLAWITERRLRTVVASAERAQTQATHMGQEITQFAEVLHAHGQQAQVNRAQAAIKSAAISARLAADLPAHGLKTWGKLARQVLQLGMLCTGAWLVINNQATGGVMIAGSILLGKALAPLEVLIGSWKQLLETRKSYARLSALLHPRALAALQQPETQLPTPLGALSVQQLAIKAPQSDAMLLHSLSFALPAGAMLAVLGASGSGKSTLARALVGAISPQRGDISLDGAALHQYHASTRGPATGYLPQDVQLHSGSIAHNIARLWQPTEPLTPAQSAAVIAAAKLAGAHDLITALPQGYDTRLGHEPGATPLSGGQRQRIALARAVYGQPSLVVLDEPNSQLDAEGEAALESCLRALQARRATVVAISHRPHLIELASHVLVLRGGTAEQFGPRDQVRQWIAQRNQLAMKRSAAPAHSAPATAVQANLPATEATQK